MRERESETRGDRLVVAGVFLFAALAFAVVAGGMVWSQQSLARFGAGASVRGEVVRTLYRRDGADDVLCRIVVAYEAPVGVRREHTDVVWRQPCPASHGAEVLLFYAPDDPSRARIAPTVGEQVASGAAAGAALLCLVLGLRLRRRARRIGTSA